MWLVGFGASGPCVRKQEENGRIEFDPADRESLDQTAGSPKDSEGSCGGFSLDLSQAYDNDMRI